MQRVQALGPSLTNLETTCPRLLKGGGWCAKAKIALHAIMEWSGPHKYASSSPHKDVDTADASKGWWSHTRWRMSSYAVGEYAKNVGVAHDNGKVQNRFQMYKTWSHTGGNGSDSSRYMGQSHVCSDYKPCATAAQ